MRFGASDRLRRSADFIRLQRGGLRYQSAHFVLYGLKPVPATRGRLGITVSRRVGGAVVRNRLKRRVRECYRLAMRAAMPPGAELVVIARSGAGGLESRAIGEELMAGAAFFSRRLR